MNVRDMPAGRELDRLIAETFGFPLVHICEAENHCLDGSPHEGSWCYTCGCMVEDTPKSVYPFSTNIAYAWKLVVMNNLFKDWIMFRDCDGRATLCSAYLYPDWDFFITGETFPHAISLAALIHNGVEEV